jgi:hypothetical protein
MNSLPAAGIYPTVQKSGDATNSRTAFRELADYASFSHFPVPSHDGQSQRDRRALARQRTAQWLPEEIQMAEAPLEKYFVALVTLLQHALSRWT